MPRFRSLLPSVLVCLAAASALAFDQGPAGWPPAERDHKPWTRWWWPASAVDQANLTRQLELIAAAPLGGVEVTPIYGAREYEARYSDFLSPTSRKTPEPTAPAAPRPAFGAEITTAT